MIEILVSVVKIFTTSIGGHNARHLLEYLQKVVVVCKPDALGNLIDLQCRLRQQLLCAFHTVSVHVIGE